MTQVHFFDVATLQGNQITSPMGSVTLDPALGEAQLFARRLTVTKAPLGLDFTLVADDLTVADAGAFSLTPRTGRRVRVIAEAVHGPLNVVNPGAQGAKGVAGKAGFDGTTRIEVIDPTTKPPLREKVTDKPPQPGGDGQPGGPGGAAGPVTILFRTTDQPPTASAPGGKGGFGGSPGSGGDNGIDSAPDGHRGPNGPTGPPGVVTLRQVSDAKGFKAQGHAMIDQQGWGRHRLQTAEFHYRRATSSDLTTARQMLVTILDHPGYSNVSTRARQLLQQLFEHVTYLGLPRDFDVTPDVVFAAQDNAKLLNLASTMLTQATSIAGTATVVDSFAKTIDTNAEQLDNLHTAGEKRVDAAQAAVTTAVSGTDLAQARVKAIDTNISELKKVLENEIKQDPGPFGQLFDALSVGAEFASLAVGVASGVGAVGAVGKGFAMLQKTVDQSTTTFDLISDVTKKLKDPALKDFKRGVKDLANGAKSLYDLGALTAEVAGTASSHPDPRVREIAKLQREQMLLNQEVALHRQMEKEAQLGVGAAVAEQDALKKNAGLARSLAGSLRASGSLASAPVLSMMLTTVRQVLDALDYNVFLTRRAREIYLALDPTDTVSHDLGMLHPDEERLLTPAQRVQRVRGLVNGASLRIIQWSSLVEELVQTGGLSRTPISFFFSAQAPELIDPFRATGTLGFQVAIEDILSEDGSDLFEVKLDSVEIMLHGATMAASGDSIKLRQLGAWSVRRRPTPGKQSGEIKNFVLPARELAVEARPVPGGVLAVLPAPQNERGTPPFSVWARGVAGDWVLEDDGKVISLASLTRVEVGFRTMALSATSTGGRRVNSQRQLRPLPGGVPKIQAGRPPIRVPSRGPRQVGYGAASVAAVGIGQL